jgi:hypothetical protein
MACYNSNCYLPQPPRQWSRVQNSCSLITANNNTSFVQVPYSTKIVPGSELAFYLAMLNKGNILQYKGNSSNITQAQKYSKIAKGKWVNRNTTWATQSTRGYTNPNTTQLKRSGNVVNIAIDPVTGTVIGPTSLPVTCPKIDNIINNVLPTPGGGGSVDTPVIPPPPPTPSKGENIIPVVPVPPLPDPIIIQDQGSLVCSVQENICTGEIKSTLANQSMNLTTDSDVPGRIEPLYWNDGTPTWYPRQRYVMTNSGNKWPYNSGYNNVNALGISLNDSTLQSAVKILPPVITIITILDNIITLDWTQNDSCFPITSFTIYLDDIPYSKVAGNIRTTNIIVPEINCKPYFVYIVAQNNNIFSDKSNIESFVIKILYAPTITHSDTSCTSATIYWTLPTLGNCINISYYNIYQNDELIGTAPATATNYTISNLNDCINYSFYIIYVDTIDNIESNPSNEVTVDIFPCPPTLDTAIPSNNAVTLTWTAPTNTCDQSTITYNVYYSNGSVYTKIPNVSSSPYIVGGLTNGDTYSFYVTTYSNPTNNRESTPSNILSTTLTIPDPPTNCNATQNGIGTVYLTWTAPINQDPSISSYNIYYSTGGYIQNVVAPSTSTTITGLTLNTTYDFQVSSVNTYDIESVKSSPSNNVTISLLITNISNIYGSGYYYTDGQVNPTPYVAFTANKYPDSWVNPLNNQGIEYSFDINYNTTINYLIIAGGGGGDNIGGGGGGGVLYGSTATLTTGSYIISVGGFGGSYGGGPNNTNGGPSSIIQINYNPNPTIITHFSTSGGGGAGTSGNPGISGGLPVYIDGQYYSTNPPSSSYQGGAGGSSNNNGSNVGLNPIPLSLFNVLINGQTSNNFYISGGGGGGSSNNSGNAGTGIGGSFDGGNYTGILGYSGGNYYYGGGGGGAGNYTYAGNGSTGFILLWYS